MAANSWGSKYCITTAGESHGPAYVTIIDGCPAGLQLEHQDIQKYLDKRRPGQSRYTSQRREKDIVEILSGVFAGKTTGTSIALLIRNHDQHSSDYNNFSQIYRPGHADFTYDKKYGHYDHRGGGRASARETMLWVAAGAIAQKYLYEKFQLKIYALLEQIGDIYCPIQDLEFIENNEFFCASDEQKTQEIANYITKIRKNCDAVGARVTAIVKNVPIGLGEPIFEKLDGNIAKAMMNIPAVKGVEIGAGFSCVHKLSSEFRDAIHSETKFASNNAGGVLAGISTGQDIHISVAFKPTSSIAQSITTINHDGQQEQVKVTGRHDPCVGIRGVPVVQGVLANLLMDAVLSNYSTSTCD